MEPYKLLYINDGICNIHVFEMVFCFVDLCRFLTNAACDIHPDSSYYRALLRKIINHVMYI